MCLRRCPYFFRAGGLVALAAAYMCAGIPLALVVPLGMWYMCFVAVVRSPVACGSLISVTCRCPSYHASFLPADGLEYREHRTDTWVVGRRRGARGGGLFGGGYISLFIPCCACGGSHGVCVHGHIPWLLGARGHSCMCFMLWCTFVYFSVLRFAFRGSLPLDFHTPCLSHGVLVLCVRGTVGGMPFC